MAKLKRVFCTTCKRPIYRSIGRINENLKLGHNFYCSKKCESRYKNKKQLLVCENCGKRFTRVPSDISSHNYCSKSCAAIINNKKCLKGHAKIKPKFKTCIRCGKRFRKSTGNKKYCSIKCRREAEWHMPKEILGILRDTAQKIGRVPARRELRRIDGACRKLFGSWNNAITAAGFQPNRSHSQRMYKRTKTRASDGHLCDSVSEALVDNWLTENSIFHERDVSYPETHHKTDWAIFIGSRKIFIEYFGLANDSPRYDRAIRKKRELCRKHKLTLIEIYPWDLYPEVRFDTKLKNELKIF